MALQKQMNIKQIEKFLLKGDMYDVLKYDIEPILHLDEEPGGYFGVPRQIFSLVDFLGAMYTGEYRRGKSSRAAIKYIQEVMGSDGIDPNYKNNGKLMYEMYRHGLVHLFQPKMFELEHGTKIEWCVHKRGRTDDIEVKNDRESVYKIGRAQHLEIRDHPTKNSKVLIISLKCLFEDFNKSLRVYFQIIDSDKNNYIPKWNKVAGYITDYERWPVKRKNFIDKLSRFMKIFCR